MLLYVDTKIFVFYKSKYYYRFGESRVFNLDTLFKAFEIYVSRLLGLFLPLTTIPGQPYAPQNNNCPENQPKLYVMLWEERPSFLSAGNRVRDLAFFLISLRPPNEVSVEAAPRRYLWYSWGWCLLCVSLMTSLFIILPNTIQWSPKWVLPICFALFISLGGNLFRVRP